ncbi:hypothetical protein STSP2_00328 [Anaerohalosphaera lusitana]|uniref:Lipopolysaccharide-assembly n=1 Tax=Anaerohalosphaera lusitana TaxID=1936003 RepID=A0A1U9NHA4_9BACT|nr:LPS assembly lipoprotein LptE [Anaerohalosphaera lusitana]AQT67185.1 hypothetical protein STSP2_00328 [Anaerohalosphaera lusitana]
MKTVGNTLKMAVISLIIAVSAVSMVGCVGSAGDYSNTWVYPENVASVYVEMFDTRSFRRGFEYTLSDAVMKRLEAETTYKIVSDRDLADTVLTGQVGRLRAGTLARDRETGRPLENEAFVTVQVSWKDLRSGELLINNQEIAASAPYSTFLGQDFDYASRVAMNRAAQKIVERMQVEW